MRLYKGVGGWAKTSMALKEKNSNEEPSSGGRPLQISVLLPSLTDLADRIHRRIYRCKESLGIAKKEIDQTSLHCHLILNNNVICLFLAYMLS